MHCIQPKSRIQTLLFGSLENFIPHDHPVRFIDAIVSSIVQSNLDKFQYRGKEKIGRKAYGSETMLKLFLYGYLNKISSSRKLEVETHRNIELKWLLGDLQPDHKTISDYRKNNENQIKLMTVEIRAFLKSNKYISGKTVAIDGSKIKANANREVLTADRIEKRLSKLDDSLKKYLQRLDLADANEEITETIEQCGQDLKNEALSEKIEFLREKIKKLKELKITLKKVDKKYLSPSDPDANLMKGRNGQMPSYNAQAVVDSKHHMIAECQVSTNSNDMNELIPTMDVLKKNLDLEPEEILGDKGYYNPNEIKKMEDNSSSKCFIPATNIKGNFDFKYNKETNEYTCSMGKRLVLRLKNKLHGKNRSNVFQGVECEGCPIRSKCTKSKKGRIIYRYHNQVWRDKFKKRMQSETAQKKVKERKKIVEHVFGTIKYWMGQTPLLLRGKTKVQTEINLYATAYNLKRLMNIETIQFLMKSIEEYEWNIQQRYPGDAVATSTASPLATSLLNAAKICSIRKFFMDFLKYIFMLSEVYG